MGWDSRPFPVCVRRADGTPGRMPLGWPALTGSPLLLPVLVRCRVRTVAVGLLLPWLFAPVMGDSRYHYPAAPGRFDNSILNLFPWTINDIEPRTSSGRIVPVGMLPSTSSTSSG